MDLLFEFFKIFVHIVAPAMAGITFLALAKFVRHIAPLRALVSSVQAYKAAFWGFLVFGVYLGLRPVQVLAGPHPWPLIISCIREFLLTGVFGPAAFLSLLTLCYGPLRIGRGWIYSMLGFGMVLATTFCVVNALAIGGSQEIVRLGRLTAYDGLWAESGARNVHLLMQILFYVRLLNPGLLLLIGATAVLWHARTYPEFKRRLYDNMPKKLYILSAAVYLYAAALLIGSVFYGMHRVPDDWAVYPLMALLAGLVEASSISLPVRKDVQVSEHEEPDAVYSSSSFG